MRRFGALLVVLASMPRAEDVAASSPEPVIILRPAAATCVDVEALSAAMANSTAFLPSVVPEDVARDVPSGAALFRIEGVATALRVRGWGLEREVPGPLGEWPEPWSERPPELDQEVVGHDCETATEAVAALLISVLPPKAAEQHEPEPPDNYGARLAAVLEQASRELAQSSHLTAGVLRTELGLTFIVEDVHAACRRGTWLDLKGKEPRMGQSVGALESDVLACLARHELADRRRGLTPALEEPEPRTKFGLPLLTGVLVAGLGLGVGLVSADRYDNPTPVLLYATLPAVVGGVTGYFAPEPWREALWLSGYWLGLAGASVVVVANSGDSKPLLVGGALAVGATGSGALVLVDAAGGADSGIPAWAIALPAVVGAGAAFAGLFLEGEKTNSAELVGVGAFVAVAPAFWLAARPDPRPHAGALRLATTPVVSALGVSIDRSGASLQLQGEL